MITIILSRAFQICWGLWCHGSETRGQFDVERTELDTGDDSWEIEDAIVCFVSRICEVKTIGPEFDSDLAGVKDFGAEGVVFFGEGLDEALDCPDLSNEVVVSSINGAICCPRKFNSYQIPNLGLTIEKWSLAFL